MNRTKLPIHEIIIQDRQRDCKPEAVTSLAESMRALGLIQPIVINQEKRVIAGGHRLAAAVQLGWTEIDVCYRETLSEAELQELELTENIKRSDLTWQERCQAVAKIHQLKCRSSAKDSKTWGQRETGDMLGISQGHVSYSIIIARVLAASAKDSEIWQCTGLADAWNLIMRWEQERVEAELAKRHVSKPGSSDDFDDFGQDVSFDATSAADAGHAIADGEIEQTYDAQLRQILEEKGRYDYYPEVNQYPHLKRRICQHYIAAGNKEEDFEVYWQKKLTEAAAHIEVIDLSSHYVKDDCIAFMNSHANTFDHIITDIPYGIDIESIDQHFGIKDIAVIKEEHTVEGNEALYERFFPAAYHTLKDNAFLITWCDQMQWQRMYDLAIKAGFKVQRWPITWVKTHPCLNQMAQYNFTKSTEIAMVMRKGNITLVEKQSTCVVSAARDGLCDLINHPFAKPFDLWQRLFSAVSIENQYILDPFAGRGSSLIAGIKLGRNMVGIELNETHYNAGLETLKSYYLTLNPKTAFQ